ncbi:MAG: hypothetical protein HDQ98_11680 [Lachnospiraceae bacterium]|nr:hypothetical protein [Lachnospiraceae bacterium]
MRIRYRFIAYVLSVSIIFVTVFSSYCQSVFAASEAIPIILEQLPKVVEGVQWALANGGDGTVMSSSFVQDFYESCKDRINPIQCVQNPDGTVTFSEEALNQLRDIFDEYLADHPEAVDVVWIPVISSDRLASSTFYSLTQYNQFRSYADNVSYSFINPRIATSNFFLFKDASDFVFYRGNGGFNDSFMNQISYLTSVFGQDNGTGSLNLLHLNLVSSDGVGLSVAQSRYDGAYMDSGLTTTGRSFIGDDGTCDIMYPFGAVGAFFNDQFFLVRGSKTDAAPYVPIFSNLNAYKDWVTGNGNYYRFESGYTGGDITINPDADYSEIINAIRSAMLQSIESGKNISEALSAMQKSFTLALAKINGTLGDISDNTAAMNEWLEKIYQKLSEIYNTDDDNDSAFDLLFSGLRSMTVLMELYDTHMDDRFLKLEALLYSYFSSASENLEESKGFLENISDKLDDIYKKLKAILFVESADLAFDILSKLFDSIYDWIENKFTDFGLLAGAATVGEIMKTKFPFSIPWDIYSILLMFNAPPKPPVISLHFEFPFIDFEWDYEYVMDDKAWSDLAFVCRFFLTIGYEITLIHLTQKLYAAGLFDIPSVGRKKH